MAAPEVLQQPAQAMDLAEKMEQAQKRKEGILAETRKEAQEAQGAPAESSAEAQGGGGSSYFDKISKGFSMKVDGAPAMRDEAKPKEEAPRTEAPKSSFSFGGFGGGGAQSEAPEKKAVPSKPAVPEPPAPPAPQTSEPKPSAGAKGEEPKWWEKLDFAEPKKEEVKPQQSATALPPAPAPKPEPAPAPAPAPQLPKAELPKPSSTQKYESEVKDNKDGKRTERNKKDQQKSKKKKKSNGFKLFGSQMLMLGAFVGGTYALLFKGDLLSGWMEKADAAILSATSKE